MEFLIVTALLLAQRFWWQPLPWAELSIHQLLSGLPWEPKEVPDLEDLALWVVMPTALILMLSVMLDDALLGLPLLILSVVLILLALNVQPSGPILDALLLSGEGTSDAASRHSEGQFSDHLVMLHRELLTPILLLLVMGIWSVVAWRLGRWWLDRASIHGRLHDQARMLDDILSILESMTLRVSLLVLVFWRSYRAVWSLFVQSLENWRLDVDATLLQMNPYMTMTSHDEDPLDSRSAPESFLNRLLLGWAGLAALLEILLS